MIVNNLPVVPGQDAPAVDTDLALAEHVAEIKSLGKRVLDDVYEIGRHLAACKQIIAHGSWLHWLDAEFGWSEATARNFINVYEASKSAKFANLKLPLSGLYLLAAPSTPQGARQEIADRVKAGAKPSVAEIKEVVERAKSANVQTREPAAEVATVVTAPMPADTEKAAPVPAVAADDAAESAEARKKIYAEQAELTPAAAEEETLFAHWQRLDSGTALTDFLDAIGVEGVLQHMSAAFGAALRARVPAPKLTKAKAQKSGSDKLAAGAVRAMAVAAH